MLSLEELGIVGTAVEENSHWTGPLVEEHIVVVVVVGGAVDVGAGEEVRSSLLDWLRIEEGQHWCAVEWLAGDHIQAVCFGVEAEVDQRVVEAEVGQCAEEAEVDQREGEALGDIPVHGTALWVLELLDNSKTCP